jgi:hypothetical protein
MKRIPTVRPGWKRRPESYFHSRLIDTGRISTRLCLMQLASCSKRPNWFSFPPWICPTTLNRFRWPFCFVQSSPVRVRRSASEAEGNRQVELCTALNEKNDAWGNNDLTENRRNYLDKQVMAAIEIVRETETAAAN